MIRTLIIDDEALARRRIRHLLEQRTDISIVEECRNGEQAISAIERENPDLVFLDIQMKDMTGFEVLDQVRSERLPLVIFVTAYDQYAIKAFDIFAFDYLLKPFKDDRFERSVDKAIERLQQKSRPATGDLAQIQALLSYLSDMRADAAPPSRSQTIPIKGAGKISFVDVKDIIHIEASGYYIEIHTADKRYLLRESLSSMTERLDGRWFLRIHRSTVINLQHLEEIQHQGAGDVEVLMKTGRSFRVSKSYRDGLFERLGI